VGYQRFRNGFEVSTNSAIDKRLYLTKLEMKTAHESFNMPGKYINICPDDGKLYIYSEANEIDEDLGKFRLLESSFDFTDEEANKALAEGINAALDDNIDGIVQTIQDNLNNVNGGDIE